MKNRQKAKLWCRRCKIRKHWGWCNRSMSNRTINFNVWYSKTFKDYRAFFRLATVLINKYLNKRIFHHLFSFNMYNKSGIQHLALKKLE